MADDRMTSQDSDVYKTLLESTKAIPWRIDWKTMCFTYILRLLFQASRPCRARCI